jgi:hypothetical protein
LVNLYPTKAIKNDSGNSVPGKLGQDFVLFTCCSASDFYPKAVMNAKSRGKPTIKLREFQNGNENCPRRIFPSRMRQLDACQAEVRLMPNEQKKGAALSRAFHIANNKFNH